VSECKCEFEEDSRRGAGKRVCEIRDDLLRPTIEFVSQQIHF